MELDFQIGVIAMVKAYEKRIEEIEFEAYLNYRQTDAITKQIRAVVERKDQEPTLSFDEWKKPLGKEESTTMLTEEQKEKIREHTRKFGKGGE